MELDAAFRTSRLVSIVRSCPNLNSIDLNNLSELELRKLINSNARTSIDEMPIIIGKVVIKNAMKLGVDSFPKAKKYIDPESIRVEVTPDEQLILAAKKKFDPNSIPSLPITVIKNIFTDLIGTNLDLWRSHLTNLDKNNPPVPTIIKIAGSRQLAIEPISNAPSTFTFGNTDVAKVEELPVLSSSSPSPPPLLPPPTIVDVVDDEDDVEVINVNNNQELFNEVVVDVDDNDDDINDDVELMDEDSQIDNDVEQVHNGGFDANSVVNQIEKLDTGSVRIGTTSDVERFDWYGPNGSDNGDAESDDGSRSDKSNIEPIKQQFDDMVIDSHVSEVSSQASTQYSSGRSSSGRRSYISRAKRSGSRKGVKKSKNSTMFGPFSKLSSNLKNDVSNGFNIKGDDVKSKLAVFKDL